MATRWNVPEKEGVLWRSPVPGLGFSTGEEIWRIRRGGDLPVPTPVIETGRVFLTSAHGAKRPIYAVKLAARGDVTPTSEEAPGPEIAWYRERAGNYLQTPIIYRGRAYFCHDNGVLSCFDSESGERHYRLRLGGGRSGFTASAVAGDGKIYFSSEDGDVYVVRDGPEHTLLATNPLGGITMATPAIADGVLYFRARSHVMAIGEKRHEDVNH